MKVDRSRIEEALRSDCRDAAARDARRLLPELVDTEAHRPDLERLGVDVDHLLDHLGRGGLGKMIGG